ncbi:MAG: hypothetical protein ACRD12_03610, partial [Acidimicrobiales bacterium]
STTAPPDPTLVELMDGAGMTATARRMFLGATPRVEDKATLAQSCAKLLSSSEPGTVHTYGCVVSGKVHLREFDNPEMRDFRYVVAAHELLHLAYARLPAPDRARIDAELRAARTDNALLEERLAIYSQDANDTLNEVHAVIGTEFAGLSAELEAHFSRYFDRGRVTDAYERTLGGRLREIRRLKAVIAETEARLDALKPQLDALRQTGPVRTYNALVDEYNAVVAEHNAAVQQGRALSAEYNELTGG